MKKVLLGLFLFLLFPVLSGCLYTHYLPEPKVTFLSDIPYYTCRITVMNGTNYYADIINDGRLIWENVIPGDFRAVEKWNVSNSSAETSIVVRFKDSNNRFVGTAYRTFYVSGYHRQSPVWNISRYDIRQ